MISSDSRLEIQDRDVHEYHEVVSRSLHSSNFYIFCGFHPSEMHTSTPMQLHSGP